MINSAFILFGVLRQDNSIRLSQLSADEWKDVIDFAFNQGVDAISVDGYNACLSLNLPTREGTEIALETDEYLDDLKFEWFGSVLQAEEDYRHFEKVICSLANIFAENGMKMMVLKGYGLSQDYPVPAHRRLGDIDIFLSDGHIPLEGRNPAALKGDEIFRSLGMEVNTDNPHHSVIQYDGISVENHHFILDNDTHFSNAKIERRLRELMRWDRLINIDGAKVYLPSDTFGAMHLLRHSGGDFCSTGTNLRHVMDWGMFIKAHHEEIDFEELVRSTKEFHCIRWMGCLNAICVDYLGMDASIFSPVETDKALVERIVNDIFQPEFQGKIPDMKHLLAYGLAKTRRMIANRWKYPLVYEEGLLRNFWTLAKNRVRNHEK